MSTPPLGGLRQAQSFWSLPYRISRHVERVLFVLLCGMAFSFALPAPGPVGATLCAVSSAMCLIVYQVRNRSLWREENRFVRAPWLGFGLLLMALVPLFSEHALPYGLLGLTTIALLLNLLMLEFRNRRFLARMRVYRRRRQHMRWQRQRRELQSQLQEGLRWMAALQHDVRQPLQALGLLLSSPRINRDPQFESLVRQLQGCHQWIYELSENATEIAAIQAHRPPPPERAPVDLIALVSSFSNWMAPLAISKGLRVSVTLPAGLNLCMVTTDARKLKRVLANLLHNALRYSPDGEVGLILRLTEGRPELTVSDQAEPLPSHILTRLTHLELPDPGRGGLRRGLGLFVVIGFCLQMGWRLQVSRHAQGGNQITLQMEQAAAVSMTAASQFE